MRVKIFFSKICKSIVFANHYVSFTLNFTQITITQLLSFLYAQYSIHNIAKAFFSYWTSEKYTSFFTVKWIFECTVSHNGNDYAGNFPENFTKKTICMMPVFAVWEWCWSAYRFSALRLRYSMEHFQGKIKHLKVVKKNKMSFILSDQMEALFCSKPTASNLNYFCK